MYSPPANHEGASPLPRCLSQGQLNLLTTCPRKFQYTFLEGLTTPESVDQQERRLAGTHFHLLMQQWQMGLPISAITQQDPQLAQWFNAFLNASPQILTLASEPPDRVLCQSEQERSLEIDGYRLTVVYDLLLTSADQARILDWKTYPKPQTSHRLIENWQTRLYLYVLAETSAYRPAQLSMVYWFFQSPGSASETPQSLQVSYNQTQHEQTRQDLQFCLAQLTDWLGAYQAGASLPQLPDGATACTRCAFATRCGRAVPVLPMNNRAREVLLNLAEIQEVPL
ncbi:MAG TPA: PD-(D/E)XK nuclease family protein [Coleofasciculaceae cyanobacterium]